ncbi:MAG: ThuA domain-containing protein [Acidobacteriota bacterium]
MTTDQDRRRWCFTGPHRFPTRDSAAGRLSLSHTSERRQPRREWALGICLGLLLASAAAAGGPTDVLVFTRTEGFAHPSIADGVLLIETLGVEEGFSVTVTDEATDIEPATLSGVQVVVWMSTTGDVLDPEQEDAFRAFMNAGGGYVGVHASVDCEYGWPWYGELLGNGAWFGGHPPTQEATLVLERPDAPGAGTFEATTPFTEEWFNFQANPRPVVDVVMTVDESSYDPGPGAMGDDHPIAWSHAFAGGRVFYTALGHRPETYSDPRFVEQIREAIVWAAGAPIFANGFETGDLGGWSDVVSLLPTGPRASEHQEP